MKGLKNRIANLVKNFKALNVEANLGVLFLIPPIIGVLFFILNLFNADLGFDAFPDSWNCIYDYRIGEGFAYAATPAIPLYLGLMAIAGAYLIKGNLKKDN